MAKAPVIRIPRPRVSEIELCAWVAQAEPGAVLEYHRGYLAHDLAERGLVHLVQRRHGPEDYSYFAVARPRAKGALPDFASHVITEEAA
jgi:hypothetical protein